ncbi:hypothetical protein BDSB_23260 [Burkholderia dolosa PC543]|nr:hypothetical protein BDSB_23260 [Burkholderia dolosa PC543]
MRRAERDYETRAMFRRRCGGRVRASTATRTATPARGNARDSGRSLKPRTCDERAAGPQLVDVYARASPATP